jgi:hypothetical protein
VVATHQFEHGRVHFPVRVRADMSEVRHPCLHVYDERNRACNVAQRPQSNREIKHCGDAEVRSKAKGQIIVPPRLEQSQRLFELIPRLTILAGEPMSDPGLR